MDAFPPSPPRLLRVMDHSLDFMEILDVHGVVKDVTSAIKSLGGYEPQDLIGCQYHEIIHPQDRPRAAAAFARALSGTRAETVKLRYFGKGGTWRTVVASIQSFLGDPAVRAVVLLTRDVTEQADAESALVLANSKVAELTERLRGAADTERRFIAAELHDDVQQILVGLRMSMSPSRDLAADQVPSGLVEGWMQLVQTVIDHLHELTLALRKPIIDNRGLPSVMRAFVDNLPLAPNQKVMFDTDVNIGNPAPIVALACFRIVQEGLSNAVRHSGAKNLKVVLKSAADRLTVSVRDDGQGFDVKDASARATGAGSVGLSSMRERAALAGGRFEIESSIGHGTRIRASFPVDSLLLHS